MGLERIFLQLFNMSITAGYVIMAVLIIRLCIRRLPKIYSYILWSIVAFRLLCPVSFASAFSFFNLHCFDEVEKNGARIQYVTMEADTKEAGNPPVMRNGSALPSEKEVSDITGTEQMAGMINVGDHWGKNLKEILPGIFSSIWAMGVGILLIYSLFEIIKIKKQTADAVLLEGNIYESDRIRQPFVFGMIRPKIYIPFRLQGQEREYILGHELYHIRRRDYLVKGLAYGIAVVYWFHPLIWAAYYFMCQDMEMSCDEKVISRHGSQIKQSYGRLLLSFATEKRKLAGPLNFGESNAGKRIKNVLKYKKTGIAAAFLGGALLIILCLVFATNAKSGAGKNSVIISVTDEQPPLASTILPGNSIKGEFSFESNIESYLVFADIYKGGKYEGRRVIVSHDMTAYEDGFSPLTGFWVNEEGGDTEGKQSSLVISYNTGMISRVSNIPISERATMEAGDILWADGKQHEITADQPYIYMAKYIGWGDMDGLECFRCENLNQADEEEWNRCIRQECITVLLSFVFSERPERELLKEYKDSSNANDTFAGETIEDGKGDDESVKAELPQEAERKEMQEQESERKIPAKQAETEPETELYRVMDRIVEKCWGVGTEHPGDYGWNDFMMEYKAGNEELLWEDHLIYFDGTDNGCAEVYGVISPEFGTKGILIDYKEKKGDESNTNYFQWDWDVLGFCPQIEMADFDRDGREEILLRLCGLKDPDIMFKERLFIFETYETCHVDPLELTSEMIDGEIENLLETEIIEDEHRVKISEKGTDRVLIPKLFFAGAEEFWGISYSDFVWIDYDESSENIYVVINPVVYTKSAPGTESQASFEGGTNRFRPENELIAFKVRYDYSQSMDSGYFSLSNPALRKDIHERP